MKIERPVIFALLLLGRVAAGGQSFVVSGEDRARIEHALPERAIVQPAGPRRLLIFTLNVGYGGHPSIAYANEAFTMMGRKTGAFETAISNDPAVFERGSLSRFNAVFFNNTVGNCFTNPDLRRNLLEFIIGGGGLLGVHGTSVAFTHWPGAIEDWPEFGYLIGARGANHKDSDEHVWLKLDDPVNPITQVFGGEGFDYRDEFFRPQGTYSRNRVRVLLSIDTSKTDPNKGQPRGDCYRPDNDYAAAWIRNYGRGRIFYCTIAHNPYVFWDPKMLQFYLAAAQFAIGDLKCPTTPSARLTPEVRAQEKFGWRLVSEPGAGETLAETVDRAARLNLVYVGGRSSQRLTAENPKLFGPDLTDAELSEVRIKLETACVRLVSYETERMPEDWAMRRNLFEFARKMGIETFICQENPEDMDGLERYCRLYQIAFALGARPDKNGEPKAALKLCGKRGAEMGASIKLGEWLKQNASPVKLLSALKNKLLVVDLDKEGLTGAQLEKFLAETRRLRLTPVFMLNSQEPSVGTRIDLFNATCLKLK